MEQVVVGLDLGTSSCKATVFDLDGRALARAQARYRTTTTPDGSATQRPADWTAAAMTSLAGVASALSSAHRVAGIGLSGQIGTHVLLDATGSPLHDAITWQDGRAAGVAEELWSRLDRVRVAEELRTWLPSGAAWPLVRLLWLSRALPRELETAARIAQPKDLLVAALTGRLVSDPSSWRGIVRPDGTVLAEALDELGLPDLLPEIAPGASSAGGLLPEVADRVGLPAGTPVLVGWNDLNAALLGVGAVDSGDAFDVGGTSEHIGLTSDRGGTDFSIVTVPHHGVATDRFTVYGVTSNAGSAVEWMRRLGPGLEDADEILRGARGGAGAPLFLPYLYGERAPVWDAAAAGAFVGLRSSHGIRDLGRAVLEGIAFNLRQIFESLPGHDGARTIRTTGGTAGSEAWNQVKADVLGRELVTMTESDSSSLGAAMTAAMGAGLFGSPAEAAGAMVHERRSYPPDPEGAVRYDELYADFRLIHPALAETSHRLTRREQK